MGDILRFFQGTPRAQQHEILEILEREFDNYDVFVLRCPVGAGKSRIATCLAAWLFYRGQSSMIMTPTNILQQQYLDDCPDLPTLWRESHYRCDDCDEVACSDCRKEWLRGIGRIKKGRVGLCNFYTYLTHRAYKDVLIADEAHQLIPMLQELAARRLWQFQYKYPASVRTFADLIHWIESIPAQRRDKKLRLLYEDLTSPSSSFMVYRTREDYRKCGERDVLKLVPIDTSAAPPLLWPPAKTNKIVLMSATISDKDVEMMGLSQRRVLTLDCDSPISPAVRPVVLRCELNMSYRYQETAVPLLAQQLRELLDQHPHKGIIHCTYAIATQLRSLLDNPRLMWHNKADKKAVYQQFRQSQSGVLVASGLYEGVDLPYDLGRWQAICKVPYPSLGDPAIRRRSELDPDWYSWSALRCILQASGRICRAPDDYGVTYILDSSFLRLPRRLMPRWFRHALYERPRF